VRGMDKPFAVRIIVYRDPKMAGSVVDAEIAGQRTLVSCRPGLLATRAALAADGTGLRVSDVKVSELAGE